MRQNLDRVQRPKLVTSPPDWYHHDKYSKAEELSLAGWYQVLDLRHCILEGVISADSGIRSILADPLAAPDAPAPEAPVRCLHPARVVELARKYEEPDYQDLLSAWSYSRGTPRYGARLFRRPIGGGPTPDVPALHKRHLTLLCDRRSEERIQDETFATEAHLFVDLSVDDKTLVESFKTWLRADRELMDKAGIEWRRPVLRGSGGKGQFSNTERKNWSDLRVLDYLDFLILSKAQGVPMPTAERLGAWFFPGQPRFDVVDCVRQRVKKRAAWLTSRQVLRSMSIQAEAEKSLAVQKT